MRLSALAMAAMLLTLAAPAWADADEDDEADDDEPTMLAAGDTGEPTLARDAASQPVSPPASQPSAESEESGPPGVQWLKYGAQCNKWIEDKTGICASSLLSYTNQVALAGPQRGRDRSAWEYKVWLKRELWAGSEVNFSVEGGNDYGLDTMVNSLLGTNAQAIEEDWIYVSRLFLKQGFVNDKIQVFGGKMDLTDYFDTNTVANDENFQFLSPALKNNPTIPFPQQGLAAMVLVKPNDLFYAQSAVADSSARNDRMGTDTAFDDDNHVFWISEAGWTPKFGERQGNYRGIFWYDSQPMPRLDNEADLRGDNTGFAFSVDQQVTDRITLFGRYGFANQETRELANFWSLGGQLTEPLPGRKKDVLGVAMAQGLLGNPAREMEHFAPNETLFEVYYSIALGKYLFISPDLQTILNAGGRDNSTTVVAGIRAVMKF